jgi:hypothetical protein
MRRVVRRSAVADSSAALLKPEPNGCERIEARREDRRVRNRVTEDV